MGPVRLLPTLLLVVLLGGQALIVSGLAYARCCTCGMSCPQGTSCVCCCCYAPCATDDTIEQNVSYNTIFNDRPLKVRGLRENRAIIASEPAFNYLPVRIMHGSPDSAMRLVAIPVGALKFQCERVNQLLNMLSDLQISY